MLPITTVCNVRCAFCSHNQNPPEVQAIAIPHLEFDMIVESLVLRQKKQVCSVVM